MQDEIAERMRIRDLIDRYCDAITQRDWANFTDFWTEDAEWSCLEPFNLAAKGRTAVVRAIIEPINEREFTVQMPHAVVIDEVRGDTARARHTLHILSWGQGGHGFSSIGVYQDQLRRTPEGWRFHRRVYKPAWHDPNRPAGAPIGGATPLNRTSGG